MTDFTFSELVNVKQLQRMMDLFHQSTGIHMRIYDRSGEVIVSTGMQYVCSKFHRLHPKVAERCGQGDEHAKERINQGRYAHYKCKNGLWNIAVPILIEDVNVATLFFGQIFYENERPDLQQFRDQALELGYPVDEYLEAIAKVPVLARSRVQNIIDYYVTFVSFLSDLGHSSLNLARDNEKRRQAEQAMRESKEKYRDLVENINDIMFSIDMSGIVTYISPSIETMSGFKAQEIVNRPFWAFIHPDDVRSVMSRFNHGLQGDTEPQEYRVTIKSGETRWVRSSSRRKLVDGNAVSLLGVMTDITERKKAEEALRESEEKYRGIFFNAQVGLYRTRISDGKLLMANQRMAEMLGYSSINEAVEDYIASEHYVDSNDRKLLLAILREKGEYNNFEARFSRNDGSTHWLRYSGRIVPEKGYIEGIAADITEEKTIERALQRSEEKYRRIFDHSPEAITVLDTSGKIIDVNPKLIELLGYTKSETIGKNIFELPYATDACRQEVTANFSRRLNGINVPPYEVGLMTKRGDRVIGRVTASPITGETGKIVGDLVMLSDITEQKQAELALRESEEKLRGIVEQSTDGIALVDEEGYIIEWNLAQQTITGLKRSDVMGKTIWDVHLLSAPKEKRTVQLHQRVKEAISQALRSGKIPFGQHSVDNQIEHPDGERRTMQTMAFPIKTAKGYMIASFSRDVTEKHRLEQFVSRAQRLETAGRIAGQVAHDFNNLLGPLMAYPELIRSELPENHSTRELLDDIEKTAVQMSEINQQLLTLGRRGHYNQEPVNLNEIVSDVLSQMRDMPADLEVRMELAPELMNINAGRSQIYRVIANLVTNARDAMKDHGILTVRTENSYVEEITGFFHRVPCGEYARLTVADTGVGISADILPRIFDPYFTTKTADKRRGSGLGLSVVHSVVEDHHGHIDCTTEPGKGSIFYLYFPITRQAVRIPANDSIVGGEERVLIVDDDEIQRDVARNLLASLGYTVAVADSGENAVSHLRTNSYDLVILDMIMPGGIDGTETLRQILELSPGQRALIVSGYAESERVKEALAMGAGDFIRKPLTLKSIARAVRTELDRTMPPRFAVHS